MPNGDSANFNRLKMAIQLRVEERLNIRKTLSEWSLNDIRDFQADLESEVQSAVSEKWIYTHFKNETGKLPRIDVLNLLSRYCGYKNWDDFTFQKDKPLKKPETDKKKGPVLWIMLILLSVSLVGWFMRKADPEVVFMDAYTKEIIDKEALNIRLPGQREGKKMTVIQMMKNADTLLVNGAYYKPRKVWFKEAVGDTLVIELLPDDYALMLNYFSRSASDNWSRREAQLMEAIHPEAKIFQSHPKYEGIELLNRKEFIQRLILPVNSLKNLEIQDIVYKDDKIYRLRFVQKIDDDE